MALGFEIELSISDFNFLVAHFYLITKYIYENGLLRVHMITITQN